MAAMWGVVAKKATLLAKTWHTHKSTPLKARFRLFCLPSAEISIFRSYCALKRAIIFQDNPPYGNIFWSKVHLRL